MSCSRCAGLGPAALAPFQGPPGAPGTAGPAGPAGPDVGLTPFAADADLGGQRVIGLGLNGSAVHASADDPDHILRVLGISTGAALAGSQVTVRSIGTMDDPSWAWVPGPIWCGLNGALTQAPPAQPVSAFSQQVAFAVSATRILVGLHMAVRLA
ncbi:hypothetical protein [Methylobacterium sp. GC_Met_2]|uniref:hypothetical protein n=1 Tax=Methylobacterium sp. GC_Met_2 TaxID=2937376 RepID=UPI00226B6ED5|nr:hypothetical protein [Methylobacterium sp. GC_Met_2]